MAGRTGLEPAASGVTGRRYNQLNYHPNMYSFFSRRDLKGSPTGRRLLEEPKAPVKPLQAGLRADLVGGTGLEPATRAL